MKFIITQNKKFDFLILFVNFVLFIINSIFLKGNNNVFFDGYFNDILAGMIILSYSNLLLDCIERRINKIYFMFIFMVFCGVFWEFVFPMFHSSSTSDVVDILAYLVGGLFYYFINHFYLKILKEG